MITLVFDGMCKGCKRADLQLEALTAYTMQDGELKEWYVKCDHREACEYWTSKAEGDTIENQND